MYFSYCFVNYINTNLHTKYNAIYSFPSPVKCTAYLRYYNNNYNIHNWIHNTQKNELRSMCDTSLCFHFPWRLSFIGRLITLVSEIDSSETSSKMFLSCWTFIASKIGRFTIISQRRIGSHESGRPFVSNRLTNGTRVYRRLTRYLPRWQRTLFAGLNETRDARYLSPDPRPLRAFLSFITRGQ